MESVARWAETEQRVPGRANGIAAGVFSGHFSVAGDEGVEPAVGSGAEAEHFDRFGLRRTRRETDLPETPPFVGRAVSVGVGRQQVSQAPPASGHSTNGALRVETEDGSVCASSGQAGGSVRALRGNEPDNGARQRYAPAALSVRAECAQIAAIRAHSHEARTALRRQRQEGPDRAREVMQPELLGGTLALQWRIGLHVALRVATDEHVGAVAREIGHRQRGRTRAPRRVPVALQQRARSVKHPYRAGGRCEPIGGDDQAPAIAVQVGCGDCVTGSMIGAEAPQLLAAGVQAVQAHVADAEEQLRLAVAVDVVGVDLPDLGAAQSPVHPRLLVGQERYSTAEQDAEATAEGVEVFIVRAGEQFLPPVTVQIGGAEAVYGAARLMSCGDGAGGVEFEDRTVLAADVQARAVRGLARACTQWPPRQGSQ